MGEGGHGGTASVSNMCLMICLLLHRVWWEQDKLTLLWLQNFIPAGRGQ